LAVQYSILRWTDSRRKDKFDRSIGGHANILFLLCKSVASLQILGLIPVSQIRKIYYMVYSTTKVHKSQTAKRAVAGMSAVAVMAVIEQ
jgi:hypothetical protein